MKIARAGANCIDINDTFSDFLIGLPEGDGGLGVDKVEVFGVEALAAPLGEVERRSGDGGEKEDAVAMADNGAGAHFDVETPGGPEVAMGILKGVISIGAGDQFDFEVEGFGADLAAFPAKGEGGDGPNRQGLKGFNTVWIPEDNPGGMPGEIKEGAKDLGVVSGGAAPDVVGWFGENGGKGGFLDEAGKEGAQRLFG